MTDFDKSKVLDRVKKMLALANDAGASEGERDNAMRMAHATLAKYNLSMAEAETHEGTAAEKRILGSLKIKSAPWQRTIAHGVAQLFFCEFFFYSTSFVFVGRESNSITASELTKYLLRSVESEGNAYQRRMGPGTIRSFCKGAANRIYWRCDELRKAADKMEGTPASNGTALVLASVYDREKQQNELMLENMGIKLRTKKTGQRDSDWSAYNSGREYGDKVGLHRQVGNGNGNSKPNGYLK